MRKTLFACSLFILTVIATLGAIAQNPTNAQPQIKEIALLGVFHFAGSNDMVSMEIPGLDSPERQKEIIDLTRQLAAIAPDKVILEYPMGKQKLDSLYQLYREGQHQLSINERQQLGFRIADLLGHEHIYTADYHMDLNFQPLMQYLEESGQMQLLDSMVASAKASLEPLETIYETGTVTDLLAAMNTEAMDRENVSIYLEYINALGEGTNWPGVEVTSRWWERNFHIMKNIDKIVRPGERALVIFGQGHTSLLKRYYADRNDVKVIDILQYLGN